MTKSFTGSRILPFMSSLLPSQLDPFKFAEREGRLQGSAFLKTMDRLSEATAGTSEHPVFADLWFSIQTSGICLLYGRVETQVQMICQRCLGLLNIEINRSLELALVRSEVEAALIEDEYETYQVGENDTVLITDLIEDELLLSLPVVPMHANRVQCDQAMLQILKRNSSEQFSEQEQSPFAVLKNLKLD